MTSEDNPDPTLEQEKGVAKHCIMAKLLEQIDEEDLAYKQWVAKNVAAIAYAGE